MIKSLYSRSIIVRWLKNLDTILYPQKGHHFTDVPIRGNRPTDGVTQGYLTKIMLEDAIAALPQSLRQLLYVRWIYRQPLQETLGKLHLTKDQYYYRCDKIVDCITYWCNDQKDEFNQLAKAYRITPTPKERRGINVGICDGC